MIDTRFSVSIQILMTLAHHTDEMVSSSLLADVLSTNATFIRKITAPLIDAGIIQSYKGKGGGITLAKRPSEINLKEVYQVVTSEKPIVQIHNKPVYKTCEISKCVGNILCDLVEGIEDATLQYLENKKLSDLMKKVS